MFLSEILNVSLIELVAGLGYLIGHFLLSKKHISGWIVKFFGAVGWALFLLQNKNYIFMAVMWVIALMIAYGFFKWRKEEYDTHTNVDKFFEILASVVAIVMISRFIILGDFHLAPIFETFIVISEITGTILLAKKKISGWYFLIIMSLLVGTLVIFINPNPAVILGILELGSIYFYCKGIQNFSKK